MKNIGLQHTFVKLLTDFNVLTKEPMLRELYGNSPSTVINMFKLEEMAFAVEISFAKARKEESMIKVRDKEELLYALTDKETFTKILNRDRNP